MDTANTEVKLSFTHIPSYTKRALDVLSTQLWLKQSVWSLAGGTALTLQCDHRTSVDLDFFIPHKGVDLKPIIEALSPDWITTNSKEDTLYGELKKAKVSFIAYPYFVPNQPFITHGSINILDARDIAVMKIIAISQRGRKRDFFDLYWYIIHRESLFDVLARVKDQYPNIQHNYHHMIKSLTYFEEAEEDPEPQIFFDTTWEQVKQHFMAIVPDVADKLL